MLLIDYFNKIITKKCAQLVSSLWFSNTFFLIEQLYSLIWTLECHSECSSLLSLALFSWNWFGNSYFDCVAQAFWFLEWHLDILIVWALSCTGRFNKAEDLLKGLKSRYGALTTLFSWFVGWFLSTPILYCRVSMMSKKKQQQMHGGLAVRFCRSLLLYIFSFLIFIFSAIFSDVLVWQLC